MSEEKKRGETEREVEPLDQAQAEQVAAGVRAIARLEAALAHARDRLLVYPIVGQAYPPDEDRGREANEMEHDKFTMEKPVDPPPEIKRAVAWLEFELAGDDLVSVITNTDRESTLIEISRAIPHQQFLTLGIRVVHDERSNSAISQFLGNWRILEGIARGKHSVALGTLGKPQVGP